MIPAFIDKTLIPHKPGIYIYKDDRGDVLYVGKAVDLYSRVSSYFNSPHFDSPKTAVLVEKIRGIETIIVESEMEALILEANLIKKFLPPYNIKLTDDKDYLYIGVTKEDFPRIVTARKHDLDKMKKYFGPFPSAKTVKETLKQLRKVFPWCQQGESANRKSFYTQLQGGTTKQSQFGSSIVMDRPQSRNIKPCFYYHLGLCPGSCVGKVTKEEYNKTINHFCKLMEGKRDELVEELTDEMNQQSSAMAFEEAQKTKKIINGVSYLLQSNRIDRYLENHNFLEDLNQQAMEQLQKDLKLPDLPTRIECYDISNFQGTNATGSMVVLTNGEVDKSQYRRFKISISGKPNDFAMHAEMMGRRLKHDEWPMPQLFIIDGGRGQVRASQEQLLKKGITTPVFGLAKRMEWLYPPEGEIVKLPKRSLGLRLLQKLRDESHRFAITYHRKLRAKSFGTVTR